MRQLFRGVDLSAYGQSFVYLTRYPLLFVGPVVAGIVRFIVLGAVPASGGLLGVLTSSLAQLLGSFITSLGLAFSLIIADAAWRRQRVTLAGAWSQAENRLGDIFFAMLGFTFVIYVAGLAGGILGSFGAIVLTFVAFYFFVYTLAAATIGGVPGSAALQASLERARDNPGPTILVTIVYLISSQFADELIAGLLLPVFFSDVSPLVATIIVAVFTALVNAYFALVLAKTYSDIAFGRRRW